MSSSDYGAIPKESGGTNPKLEAGKMDCSYLMTQRGAMKAVQVILTLIAFICACINPWWSRWGGGWVQFVTIAAFAWSLLSLSFHLFHAFSNRNARCFHVTEAIVYSVATVCLLSASIVAANRAYSRSSIVAATIFSIMATVLFGVESLLLFRDWSDTREPSQTQPTTGEVASSSQPPSTPSV